MTPPLAEMRDHDPDCSGCPACDEDMADVLATSQRRAARVAASRVFRTSGPSETEPPAPPDLNARVRALAGIPDPVTPTARAATASGVPPPPSNADVNARLRAATGRDPVPPSPRRLTSHGVPLAPSNAEFNQRVKKAVARA